MTGFRYKESRTGTIHLFEPGDTRSVCGQMRDPTPRQVTNNYRAAQIVTGGLEAASLDLNPDLCQRCAQYARKRNRREYTSLLEMADEYHHTH